MHRGRLKYVSFFHQIKRNQGYDLVKTPKSLKADLYLIAVAFVWGTTFILVKDALAYIGVYTFLGIRFIAAAGFLYLMTFKILPKINWPTVKAGMVVGLFLLAGYIFQTIGLKYTTASNAGFITGLSVVMVPIIYGIYTWSLPEGNTILGVLLAAVGLFLLSVTSDFSMSYGDILVLCCAFGFAMHIIMVGRYSAVYNPIALTIIQILFVGIVSISIGIATEPWSPVLNGPVIQALIITSVFATALAFLIQNMVQKFSTATRTALIFITEPVFAAGFAYFYAGELLTTRALIGCALIIGGMILSELPLKSLRPHK